MACREASTGLISRLVDVQSVKKDKHNLYLFTDKLKALILLSSQINNEIESLITKNTTADERDAFLDCLRFTFVRSVR